jgi:thiol-disulfide isomerase/thioredoxin
MEFNETELITVDGNVKTSINHYKGNVLVVSFFQTWCGACAAETPVLNRLSVDLQSDKFKIIYITDEKNEKLKSFRSRLASDNIIFTYSPKSLSDLGIHVYPTTFLLNKKGEVIITRLEGYDWLQEKSLIRKLINE